MLVGRHGCGVSLGAGWVILSLGETVMAPSAVTVHHGPPSLVTQLTVFLGGLA